MTDDPQPAPPEFEPAPAVAPPTPLSPPPARATRRPSNLRALVVIGVIAAFLVIVLFAVRNNESASDIAIGTCFDRPTGSTISTVEKHSCSEPHDAEVFHVADYTPGGAYPGDSTLESYIDDACAPVFESYIGEPVATSADLTYGWYYP